MMDAVLESMPPQVLIGLVTLTIVVLARLRPRAVRVRRLVIGPAIVMLVGGFFLLPSLMAPVQGDPLATVSVAVVDVVLTAVLAIARGATVEVREGGDGGAQYRYTGLTVLLWAVSVVLRFALAYLGGELGASPAVTEDSVLLTLGIALLVQNLVVVRRASRMSFVAPVGA
ncbi:hypothetical protein M2317_002549 [Microbacterium sp. ZKA21]|uniref:hypothetical protein n=1 Tax=Microbacterium sp. ZKA21 TaxID=3381694 RepID=UPI003D1FD505